LPLLDGAKAAAGQYYGGTFDDLSVAQRQLNALLPWLADLCTPSPLL
jgi:hypothetical protein